MQSFYRVFINFSGGLIFPLVKKIFRYFPSVFLMFSDRVNLAKVLIGIKQYRSDMFIAINGVTDNKTHRSGKFPPVFVDVVNCGVKLNNRVMLRKLNDGLLLCLFVSIGFLFGAFIG